MTYIPLILQKIEILIKLESEEEVQDKYMNELYKEHLEDAKELLELDEQNF